MCGFLGQIGFRNPNFDWINQGLEAIKHRGPDSSGIWYSDCQRVVFGHQRLSIIDLSETGSQPMSFKEHGLTIVFNGEIYNHLEIRRKLSSLGVNDWEGSSDTETLLKSFAILGFESTLKNIVGMFSLALYSEKSNKIFLARDRAGEKPLFYHLDESSFIFASELKAIFANKAIKKKLSPKAFNSFLENGFIPGNDCILEGFNKLEAGHFAYLDLQNKKLKIEKYWELPKYENIKNKIESEEELVENIETLLNQSVKNQLFADVDLGILLSGGIDSSLITGIASKYSSKIKTFTIKFNDKKYDESEHARLISNCFDTNHTELEVTPSSTDIIELLSKQYDEPMVDSSMIPTYILTNLVKKHCKVALGGDGADELFGGYPHYIRNYKLSNYLRLFPKAFKEKAVKTFPYFSKLINPYSRINKIISLIENDLIFSTPHIFALFNSDNREKLITNFYKDYKPTNTKLKTPNSGDLIYRLCAKDFYNYLAEDILVKTDRASMLNSLELRSPFLDHRIIEFAFGSLPSKFKINNSNKKIILKKLAKKILPKEFNLERKQGFSIPLDKWLRQKEFRGYVNNILYSTESIFPKSFINNLLRSQDKGFRCGEQIFALTQFEIWRRSYKITL